MYRHANTLFPDFEDRRIGTAAENVEDIGIGGGHLLPETAAEEVLGALLPFLEKIAR
ncbi:hypothetical protein [Rhizobium rhizogenes]|uniref:Uncharacterized protein n=1 Tax=Rhizobium rhizogenes (strain K84 / ATCC BAA-868) TaxID=311403 RepID=B9JLB9_RHIR8|nr:hypothetical protein [Rhizobium rhizogenes]ACM28618.1 hypothetical protein Arad_7031 [Rhizobium rhizogenes K84]MDJ1637107.1 hypothetical protein [Rhizobium rhizogenes]